MKGKKYFGEEYAFEFIWRNANPDGIWHGDAASLATEFDATEDGAYAVLSALCDGRKIERLDLRTYIVVNWPEKDDASLSDAP